MHTEPAIQWLCISSRTAYVPIISHLAHMSPDKGLTQPAELQHEWSHSRGASIFPPCPHLSTLTLPALSLSLSASPSSPVTPPSLWPG